MKFEEYNSKCNEIVEELMAIVDGKFAVCDTDDREDYGLGEMIPWEELNGIDYSYGEFLTATLYEYFDRDIYNIDYVCDSNKEYKACRVMIACGGPNIYIDTWEEKVLLYWGCECGESDLPRYVVDEIDEIFEQYWNI